MNTTMKKFLIITLLFYSEKILAQELFVFTEPASNMAAKSIGLRVNNGFFKNNETGKINYFLNPEIMWGVSRKTMAHVATFINKGAGNNFSVTGASFYLKYRLLSADEIHNHFRMSVFGKYAINNSITNQAAIDLTGFNAGYEGGLVATQLINKVALSATTSLVHALDNGTQKFVFNNTNRNALNYTLSIGKLILPKEYTNYKQTNLNLMLELLGQTNLGTGKTYLDIAPAAQLVIDSRAIVDVGYRYGIVTDLQRNFTKGVFVRFEYNIFNIY